MRRTRQLHPDRSVVSLTGAHLAARGRSLTGVMRLWHGDSARWLWIATGMSQNRRAFWDSNTLFDASGNL